MRATIAKRLRKHARIARETHAYDWAKRCWNRTPRHQRGKIHAGFKRYDELFAA